MKKHSLLMLLPFALIVTGCGNLSKGNIFNEKFMKANFGKQIEESYEFVAPRKVELDMGQVDLANIASSSRKYLLFIRRGTQSGFFNVLENKYVLPLDDYSTSGSSIKTASGFDLVFPYNYKEVDGVKTSYLYDERGNKIFEGEGFNISLERKDLEVLPGEDTKTLIIVKKYDGVVTTNVAYAYYDVNMKLKEVITPEEYFKRNPYEIMTKTSLYDYGHPELVQYSINYGNGTSVKIYNTKKNKFVSSFSLPNTTQMLLVGDYVYYQLENQQHKEVDDYDYFTGSVKRIVDTFRVNYLNGKEEKVKTDFIFSQATSKAAIKDSNGNKTLLYFAGVKQFQKDKTLTPARNVILNSKLKEVADVSGINLSAENVKPFGEKYWAIGNTVYNSKLEEVGYLENPVSANAKRIAEVNGSSYGLVDYTGKYIVNPVWDGAEKMPYGEYYAFSNSKVAKLFKVENEKASEIASIDLEKYQIQSSTGSDAHIIVRNLETTKDMVADLNSGAITDLPEAGATDWDFNLSDGTTTYGGTRKYASHLYRVGTSYFAITSETRVTFSYASVK